MFTIYADGQLLYSSANQGNSLVVGPTCSADIGLAGALEFTMLPGHPLYHTIDKLKTRVFAYMDGEEIFSGRVLNWDIDFYKNKTVHCEGALAFLLDTLQPPRVVDITVAQFFQQVINEHNLQVEPSKQFVIGTIDPKFSGITAKFENNSYRDTRETIDSDLIGVYGGFLRVRTVNNVPYLDYITDYNQTSNQSLIFGQNILDMNESLSSSEFFTVLLPTGADTEALASASGEVRWPLTIESVNGGSKLLENLDGIAKYGRIVQTQSFGWVTDPVELKALAQEYFDRVYLEPPITLTIKALDLHLYNTNLQAFSVGKKFQVQSFPHDKDITLTCLSIKYNFDQPENTVLKIGTLILDPGSRLTSQANLSTVFGKISSGSGGGKLAKSEKIIRAVQAIIDNAQIDTAKIRDAAITNAKIGHAEILSVHIKSGEIENVHIKESTITNSKFVDGTIEGSKIKDSTITNSHFADGTIDGSKITDSTIENSHFVAGTIEGSSIKGGTIDGTHIYNGTADNLKITNAHIQNGAITTAKIQDAQITNAKIASAGIDFLKVKNSVLDTAIFREIVAGGDVYIDRLKVADANITNLTVGNLMVKRPDGTLHRIYVDGNGALQTELVELLYQNLSSDALLKVSEWTVYKKETAPSSPYVGQLWVKPSTGIMQKCLTITPSVTWGDVKAGELHTSYIDAVAKGLNILTGGELNVIGGSVNIKSLDGVANVINMDNTGLTLSSTGQLKLQSTDSIIIGGSPFSVGGTNLLPGTSQELQSATLGTYSASLGFSGPIADYGLAVGDTITFRLWLVAPANRDVRARVDTLENGSTVIHNFTQIVAMGTSGYSELTFTIAPLTTTIAFYIDNATGVSGGTVYYKELKVEKGSIATDWSPSPQDTIDAIDALDGRLGTAETSLTGKTKIWYQSAIPVSTSIGDVWYKTDATPSVIVYRAESVGADAIASGEWVDITDSTLSKALTGLDILGDGVVQVFEGAALPTAADVMVGDMWLYTGTDTTTKKNGSMYRAVVTGADDLSEWTAFTAGAVITPYISLSANELHIDGAASLVVENSTNGNGITMNSTGMTIASGSKLAISATDLMISGKTVETYASDKIRLEVSVGGTNLVSGTRDFDGTWQFASYWTNDSIFSGLLVKRYASAWNGIGKSISFSPGEYTFSAWVRVAQNTTVAIYSNNGSAVFDKVVVHVPVTTSWQRISATFTCTTAGSASIRAELTETGNTLYVCGIKIERGNKATDWTPHVDDVRGGPNLLSGSKDFSGSWVNLSLWIADSTYEGFSVRRKASAWDGLGQNISFTPGVYTYSAYVKSSAATTLNIYTVNGTATFTQPYVSSPVTTSWQRISATFICTGAGTTYLRSELVTEGITLYVCGIKVEKGAIASPWDFNLEDPASGVKTSSVEVNTNGIYMDTTGDFNVNAGVNLSIKGGSGANSIGISNNPTDTYFMWAGNASAASAPFSVKRDGSVKATKIQHEYSHTYWDMTEYRNSTTKFPSEFWVYIPSGYTVDSVVFSYKATKFRSFAKGAASGGSGSFTAEQGPGILAIANTLDQALVEVTVGSANGHTHSISGPGATSTASGGSHGHTGSISGTSHAHSVEGHTHPVSIPGHSHPLDYGIYEDPATLPSSYTFAVYNASGTSIGSGTGGTTKTVDLASIWATPMTAGWNKINVQCGSGQAKITAFVSVKVTPA